MVNIMFIVGKFYDIYPIKVTSKNAPKWLKEGIKPFKEYINKDPDDKSYNNTIPSDVAMAAYINYYHKDASVTLFHGHNVDDLTQKQLDDQDVIFVIFDAIEVFHCGNKTTCPYESKKFERMLAKTTAFVYPHPDFHKYIINKPDYYADLRRADVPVAPFFKATPDSVIKDSQAFKDKIEKKGWKGVIIKPSYAGYSLGIKVVKDIRRTKAKTLEDHFKKLKANGFPNAVIQEFVPSFSENYEIRTYWINEQYAYSVGTLTEAVGGGGGLPVSGFDTFKSEGGTMDDSILQKLKPMAMKAIRSILQYPVKHPLIRVDIGCCINTEGCKNSYFVNEVETMAANMLADHTKYPIVEKAAEAAYEFSLKMKDKKHISGKKAKVTPLRKKPCKT